jgi:hypothetical protein
MGGWATTNDAPYGNPFGPSIGLRGGLSIYGVYVGVVYVGWAGRGRVSARCSSEDSSASELDCSTVGSRSVQRGVTGRLSVERPRAP